jgi:transcriptional regulator with XRE-family HTH domain
MARANTSKSLEKSRSMIGRKLRELRQQRRMTQVELAQVLCLSQGQLSQIEAGNFSLTAEQFLLALRTFQVSLSAFAPPESTASELQGTLSRLGASHLREDVAALPSERLEKITDAIRETLIDAESPRLITALAPVIVRNIEQIQWPRLEYDLRNAAIGRRLKWLVENVLEAIRAELNSSDVSSDTRRAYRRAEAVLANIGEFAEGEDPHRKFPPDIMDRGIRTQRSRDATLLAASAISRRWGIVTSIQPSDFADALRGARVDGL